jgi:hypothetical protein
MGGKFPFVVKLKDVFGVFCFYQLGNELKLFSKFEHSFLKDGYLFGCPLLKYAFGVDRVY